MGLTKAQRQERKDFLAKLTKEGYSSISILEAYDEKFGTHYSYANRRALKGGM